MKKTLLEKGILFLFILVLTAAHNLTAQVTLPHYDAINYSGTVLQTQASWTAMNSGDDITISAGSLFYPGLVSSLGNKVAFDGAGIDAYKSITSQTSGTVYYSYILKVTDIAALTSTTGSYFTGFGSNPTTFGGTMWLKKNSSNFNIGINARTTSANTVYSTGTYAINTEIFVVASYKFNSSTGDDVVKIWINPATADFGSGTEPAYDLTMTNSGGTDLASVGLILIRQDATLATPFIQMDELRIATTWADVTPKDVTAPSPTFSPLNLATGVFVTTKPTITFDEPVVKADGTELTDADLASLITFKKTNVSGTNVAYTATIDAMKKVITITPSSSFDNSQLYYLAIGEVKDKAGNLSTAASSTFTSISATAPIINVTYPNGGEILYSGDFVTITWNSINFDAGENVKIEALVVDGTTGNYNWIILAASTANDGSEQVTVGPDASYGIDYKIRISGVTNGATDMSDNSFTVIATETELAKLRLQPTGAIVKYKGTATVTFTRPASGGYNQKYIQDATAAIVIHDPSNFVGTYAIGDGITNVEGKVAPYYNLFEIIPQAATGVKTTGTPITPEVKTLNSITSADQAKLIEIENLTFTGATGNFSALKSFPVDGIASTSLTFYTLFGEADYITPTPAPVPTVSINAVVLVGQNNTVLYITPRSSADMAIATAIDGNTIEAIQLFPVPASTIITARNLQNVTSIEIMDITGKVIMTVDGTGKNEVIIPVSNLTHGMYFIKFTSPKGIVIKRFTKS